MGVYAAEGGGRGGLSVSCGRYDFCCENECDLDATCLRPNRIAIVYNLKGMAFLNYIFNFFLADITPIVKKTGTARMQFGRFPFESKLHSRRLPFEGDGVFVLSIYLSHHRSIRCSQASLVSPMEGCPCLHQI